MRILHTLLAFRGAHLTDEQKHYDKAVRSVIVSVEWLFGLVKNYFKFIDFKQMQRIGMRELAPAPHFFCVAKRKKGDKGKKEKVSKQKLF